MAGLCMKKKLLRSKCDAKVVKNMYLDQNGRVLQFFKIAHLRVDFPKCWHGISLETAQPFMRHKIIKQFIMTLIMTMRALILAIHHSQKLWVNNTTNLKVKQQRNGQNQSKRY